MLNKKVIVTALFLVSLLLASCSSGQTNATSTVVSATTAPTTASTESIPETGATPTVAPASTAAPAATTAPTAATESPTGAEASSTAGLTDTGTTAEATSSPAGDATPNIVVAANAFLETLSDTEKDAVLFDWTDTAQKQRWSNLPQGAFERAGLMWGDMSETQQNAWLQLMQATLSTEGYNRVSAEWNADEVLATQESGGGGGGQLVFGKQYY